jgi:hypothetical protein
MPAFATMRTVMSWHASRTLGCWFTDPKVLTGRGNGEALASCARDIATGEDTAGLLFFRHVIGVEG